MRKHLLATMLLMAGLPLTGTFSAMANPEPQQQSQSVTAITGTVLDENNEPVIGASVVQKGVSSNAAATDAFGHFTLRVPAGAVLQVSYVGYKTTEVRAAADMTVYLQPTTEMLNELVAIGYGSQKRANLTGAVATVDVARTMDSRPVTDVAKALQGAVPGLTITSANGDIEAQPTINIRGTGTLSNGHSSSPLIVVDGVPVDDMSFLNPDDIKEISVLKDASSSAIYGSRASFGVILITTKESESSEKVSLKYTNNFGWSTATILPEFNTTVNNLKIAMQNTNTGGDEEIFGMYYNELLPLAEAWAQQHNGPYTSVVELHPFVDANNVGDYWVFPKGTALPAGLPGNYSTGAMQSARYLSYADWDIRKTLFHAAPSQKHNVSLEGRSGKTNYRASFGYDSKEGLQRYNPEKFRRYTANVSVDTQIFSFLRGGTRINFSQREFESPNLQRNAYQYMWRFPSQFENYGYVIDPATGEPKYFRNDQAIRSLAHTNETETTNTRMQVWMNAQIMKGLTLQADFTYSIRDMHSEAAAVPFSTWQNWTPGVNSLGNYEPYTQATSYASRSTYRDDMWAANVFATYDRTFAENHNLKVMLGWSAEQETYDYFYAQHYGLTDYTLPNINLTDGTQYSTSGNKWHRATTGFFGRINYDYKGIYLLELNGRYDGSSRFPANDQWAFFPSGSVGYRFSEENYFEPLKSWWSNGKLRASYGQIGNETIGSNMFLSVISPVSTGSAYWLNGNQKLAMNNMPTLVSSSLTWERIETIDVGLDLGFLDNSLNISFDWFQRNTKDMLAPGAQLPATLGTSVPLENAGSLRTNGWELSASWNHSFGDWDVYVNASISDARTKITKWPTTNNLIYSFLPNNSNYTEGQYFGDIWGFETDRYFTMDDFTFVPGGLNADGKQLPGTYEYKEGVPSQAALNSGNFTFGPGDVKFVDRNGDGKIDAGKGTVEDHGDLKVIGNALPRYEYSFRLGAGWKGFDIDLFFQGVGKRNMWATGSTIVPMAQSGYGTFTNQQSFNVVEFNRDGNSPEYGMITYADINQGYDYPRMFSGAGGGGTVANIGNGCYNFYPQDRYLLNMAYLRLKNLTFGYTLPVELTRKALIEKARIYFSADNLCFLYNGAKKYQLDPEMATASGSSVQGYNDGNGTFGRTTPMMRTFSFGVQVTF